MTTKPIVKRPARVGGRFVAKLLVILVWASVAWVLSLLVHRFVLLATLSPVPPLDVSNGSSSQQSGQSTAPRPLERAFGALSASPSALRQADIQLVGLIEAGADSVVSVRIKNGPTRALRLGQTDTDGWRLESVKDGEIEISRSGQIYRLASYSSRNGLPVAVD